jgi:hypothetical protein
LDYKKKKSAFTRELPINSTRGMVFFVWSIVAVSCCCEKKAAKDENSSEIQRKGNVCLWKNGKDIAG